jgi:hypothetical protein
MSMSARSVHSAVDRATDSSALEYTARAGFAASSVLHLLVAYIVLRLAFGSSGSADQNLLSPSDMGHECQPVCHGSVTAVSQHT